MLRLFSILTGLAGCTLVVLSSYTLIDPYEVQLAIREILDEEDASKWISAWRSSAVHVLVGGALALCAAVGMWARKRWSMALLFLTSAWFLLLSLLPAYGVGAHAVKGLLEVLELALLVFVACASAIAFIRWQSNAQSPNKGFNRTPESSGPAKPGDSGGGAG